MLENEMDFRALPKVSLHDHLDGGLRPATILEIVDQEGLELEIEDNGHSGNLSSSELGLWVARKADSGSLEDYLETFAVTTAVMQSEQSLYRVAREFVEDLIEDGVVVGEVRWAPEQHTGGGLSLDQAVEAVQGGMEDAVNAARLRGVTIHVGQILTGLRNSKNCREIAELAIRHRGAGVVGFDIAGPEKGFPPSLFREVFDYLAQEFFPVTIHAGEGDGLQSIMSALVDGRALRIGHGVRIIEDIGNPSAQTVSDAGIGNLARWILDRQIPLEVSPSSNLQTGAVPRQASGMSSHPFDQLYKLGFAVTVNPDNRLMSATTTTDELALLTRTFSYNSHDLLNFQMNSLSSSFLDLESMDGIVDLFVEAYSGSQTS